MFCVFGVVLLCVAGLDARTLAEQRRAKPSTDAARAPLALAVLERFDRRRRSADARRRSPPAYRDTERLRLRLAEAPEDAFAGALDAAADAVEAARRERPGSALAAATFFDAVAGGVCCVC